MIKALIRICCIGEPPPKERCPCNSVKVEKCKHSATESGCCLKAEEHDKKKDKMLVIVISKMAKKGMYMSAVRMDQYCPGGNEIVEEVARQSMKHSKNSDRDIKDRKTQKYKYSKEQGTQKWKYKDKPPTPPMEGRRSPPPENTNPNIDSQPRVDSKTGLSFEKKQEMVSKVYEEPQFPHAYY